MPGKLEWPVLSVGSLSAGGAGKTPVVLALAALLERHGTEVDVLSRGYGRTSSAVELVDPDGPASRYGDEPVELAQAGLRVFVAAKRAQAGLLAESDRGKPRVHLVDDGFQHRQLMRDANVALLTLEDAPDRLLPAGNLREPLSALSRADAVVVRADEADSLYPLLSPGLRARVWVVRRTLRLPADTPGKPLAFCGIARPQSFVSMLAATGCQPVASVAFADHHPYQPADLDRLIATAQATGADGFVTTAKDAVKLPAADLARLNQVGRVAVARLEVEFSDEAAVWLQLTRMLRLPLSA